MAHSATLVVVSLLAFLALANAVSLRGEAMADYCYRGEIQPFFKTNIFYLTKADGAADQSVLTGGYLFEIDGQKVGGIVQTSIWEYDGQFYILSQTAREIVSIQSPRDMPQGKGVPDGWQYSGNTNVFKSLAEAVHAIVADGIEKNIVSARSLAFPLYECGGLLADKGSLVSPNRGGNSYCELSAADVAGALRRPLLESGDRYASDGGRLDITLSRRLRLKTGQVCIPHGALNIDRLMGSERSHGELADFIQKGCKSSSTPWRFLSANCGAWSKMEELSRSFESRPQGSIGAAKSAAGLSETTKVPNNWEAFFAFYGDAAVNEAVTRGTGRTTPLTDLETGAKADVGRGRQEAPEDNVVVPGKEISPKNMQKCTAFFDSVGIDIKIGNRDDLGSFSTVAGNNDAKEALYDAIIGPYMANDPGAARGILFYGPPGTGKSLLAKGLVGELSARAQIGGNKSRGVTFIPIGTSTFESKWHGEATERISLLFHCARVFSPTILFVDECDGIFTDRQKSNSEHSAKIKGEFLSAMDGFSTGKDDFVVVIGATNRPDNIDSAFQRRLSKVVYVDLPDRQARGELLHSVLKRYMPADYRNFPWYPHLLDKTRGYSGSDLVNLGNQAITLAKEKQMMEQSGRISDEVKALVTGDYVERLDKLGPLGIVGLFMALIEKTSETRKKQQYIGEAQNFMSSLFVERERAQVAGPSYESAYLLKMALAQISRTVDRKEVMSLNKFARQMGAAGPQFFRDKGAEAEVVADDAAAPPKKDENFEDVDSATAEKFWRSK